MNLSADEVDIHRIRDLLQIKSIADLLNDDDLVSNIISNPEILKNKDFLNAFTQITFLLFKESSNDDKKIEEITETYCSNNSFERSITSFKVDEKDLTIIDRKKDSKINYHAFLPKQIAPFLLTTSAWKFWDFSGKTETQISLTTDNDVDVNKKKDNSNKIMNVTFRVDPYFDGEEPTTVLDSNGDDIKVTYKYKFTLLTDEYKLPFNPVKGGNHNGDKLLSSIYATMGMIYMDPKERDCVKVTDVQERVNETVIDVQKQAIEKNTSVFKMMKSAPHKSFFIIDTYDALKMITDDYNKFFGNFNISENKYMSDHSDLCHVEKNGVLLVPETFKLFSRHVANLFNPKSISYNRSTETEVYTQQLLALEKDMTSKLSDYSMDNNVFSVYENKAGKINVSVRNFDFKIGKERLSGGIKFVFRNNLPFEKERYVDYINRLMEPILIFQGEQEIYDGMDNLNEEIENLNKGIRVVDNTANNNSVLVFVNFDVLKYGGEYYYGCEDVIFRTENIISGYLKYLSRTPLKTDKVNPARGILSVSTASVPIPLTEAYETYSYNKSFNGDNFIGLSSVVFTRTKFPTIGYSKMVSLENYILNTNKVNRILQKIFLTGNLTTNFENYSKKTTIDDIMTSSVSLSQFSYLENKNEVTVKNYFLQNFGFKTKEIEEINPIFSTNVFNTEMQRSYSDYSFVNVRASNIYKMKRGGIDTIEIFLVSYDRSYGEPVLSDLSDEPLKVIELDSKKIFYMLKTKNSLIFEDSSHLNVLSINSTREIEFSDRTSILIPSVSKITTPRMNCGTLIRFLLESFDYVKMSNDFNDMPVSMSIIKHLTSICSNEPGNSLEYYISISDQTTLGVVLPEYVTKFLSRLSSEFKIFGVCDLAVYNASLDLETSHFWLFSFFNSMLSSMMEPMFTSSFPILNKEIITYIDRKKNECDIFSDEGIDDYNTVIDVDFIFKIAIFESNIFNIYVTEIRKYIDINFINSEISEIFNDIPLNDYEILSNIIIINNKHFDKFNGKTFVLPKTELSVTFTERFEKQKVINRSRQVNTMLDATFLLSVTNEDSSCDDDLIIKYIDENVKYQYHNRYDTPSIDSITIVSSKQKDTVREVLFSIPFTNQNGKLIVGQISNHVSFEKKDLVFEGTVSLVTKCCNLVFRECVTDCVTEYTFEKEDSETKEYEYRVEKKMLDPFKALHSDILSIRDKDSFGKTCWSGLVELDNIRLNNDNGKQRASFFTVHTDSINDSTKFCMDIESKDENVYGNGVILMPTNPFKLYNDIANSIKVSLPKPTEPLKSKSAKSSDHKVKTNFFSSSIAFSFIFAQKCFSGDSESLVMFDSLNINYNHKSSDVLSMYRTKSSYLAMEEIMFSVSPKEIISKSYGNVDFTDNKHKSSSANLKFIEKDYEDRQELLSDTYSLYKFLNESFLTETGEEHKESNSYKATNIALSSLDAQIGIVESNVKYSISEPFNNYFISDDKKMMALVLDDHVQVFILVGTKYHHVSKIAESDVSNVYFSSSIFIVTSTSSVPEINKLWLIATGDEIKIDLPGNVYQTGDIVDAIVKGKDNSPRLMNDVKIKVKSSLIETNTEGFTQRQHELNKTYSFETESNLKVIRIKSTNKKSKFLFSRSNKFLIGNSNSISYIVNLDSFSVVRLEKHRGVEFGRKTGDKQSPSFESGEWITVKYKDKKTGLLNDKDIFTGISKNLSFTIIPENRSIEIENIKMDYPTDLLPYSFYKSTVLPDKQLKAIMQTSEKNKNGLWFKDTYVYTKDDVLYIWRNNKVLFYTIVIDKTLSKSKIDGDIAYFADDFQIPLNVIQNLSLDIPEKTISSDTVNGKSIVLFGKTLETGKFINCNSDSIPIIHTEHGDIYVSSEHTNVIASCYFNDSTIIYIFNDEKHIEYRIYGSVACFFINSDIVISTVDKQTNYSVVLNEEHSSLSYKINKPKKQTVNDFAVITNKIESVKYDTDVVKMSKSIDSFPISANLIPSRYNDFVLKKCSDIPDKSKDLFLEQGNLSMYIEGDTLNIIPKVIQSKPETEEKVVMESVQLEYNSTKLKVFEEKYLDLSESIANISELFPELHSIEISETAIYKKMWPLHDLNFDNTGSVRFKNHEELVKLANKNFGNNSNDFRYSIITDKENFDVMKIFFSNLDINDFLFKKYTDPTVERKVSVGFYNVIKSVAPEIQVLKFETATLFKIISDFYKSISNNNKISFQTDTSENRKRINETIRNNFLAFIEQKIEVYSKPTNMYYKIYRDILFVFNLKRFFDEDKFNIIVLKTFNDFKRNIFNRLLKREHSMKFLLSESNDEINDTEEDIRKRLQHKMISYYSLSNQFFINRDDISLSNTDGDAIAKTVYESPAPILYRAETHKTKSELEELEGIVGKFLTTKVDTFFVGNDELDMINDNEVVNFLNVDRLSNVLAKFIKEIVNYIVDNDLLDDISKINFNRLIYLLENNKDIVPKELFKKSSKNGERFIIKYSYLDIYTIQNESELLEFLQTNLKVLFDIPMNESELTIMLDLFETIDPYVVNKKEYDNFILIGDAGKKLSGLIDRIVKARHNSLFSKNPIEDVNVTNTKMEKTIFDFTQEYTNVISKSLNTLKFASSNLNASLRGTRMSNLEVIDEIQAFCGALNEEKSGKNDSSSNEKHPYLSIEKIATGSNFNGVYKGKRFSLTHEQIIEKFMYLLSQLSELFHLETIEEDMRKSKDIKVLYMRENLKEISDNFIKFTKSVDSITKFISETVDIYNLQNHLKYSNELSAKLSVLIKESSGSFNDIVSKIIATTPDPNKVAHYIELFSMNNYGKVKNFFSTNGLNVEIRKTLLKNSDDSTETNTEITIEQKKLKKGKLQGVKGGNKKTGKFDNGENNTDSALEFHAEIGENVEMFGEFVEIPYYIKVDTSTRNNDVLEDETYIYSRPSYRVFKSEQFYFEIIKLFQNASKENLKNGVINNIISVIKTKLLKLTEESYVSQINLPTENYDNLIYQELCFDMINVLTDIKDRKIFHNRVLSLDNLEQNNLIISEIANYISQIGHYMFENKFHEMKRYETYSTDDIISAVLKIAEKENFNSNFEVISANIEWLKTIIVNNYGLSFVNIDDFIIDQSNEELQIFEVKTFKENKHILKSAQEFFESTDSFVKLNNLFKFGCTSNYGKAGISTLKDLSENESYEYNKDANILLKLIKKITDANNALSIVRNIESYRMISSNNLLLFNELQDISPSFNKFSQLKQHLIEVFDLDNMHMYFSKIIEIIPDIYGEGNSKLHEMNWYVLNGNNDIDNVPVLYENYHVKTIYKTCLMDLNKLKWNQYLKTKSDENDLLKRILKPILSDYSRSVNRSESFVNKISVKFSSPVRFCPNQIRGEEDESRPISLEFLPMKEKSSPLDYYTRKSFNFSLMESLKLVNVGKNIGPMYNRYLNELSENDKPFEILDSVAGKIFGTISISKDAILRIMNDEVMFRNLKTALFCFLPINLDWEADKTVTAIEIGNKTINVDVLQVNNPNKYKGINDDGPTFFGYNGLVQMSEINTIRDEFDNTIVYKIDKVNVIVQYFKSEYLGKIGTVFNLINVETNNYSIRFTNLLFGVLKSKNGIVYSNAITEVKKKQFYTQVNSTHDDIKERSSKIDLSSLSTGSVKILDIIDKSTPIVLPGYSKHFDKKILEDHMKKSSEGYTVIKSTYNQNEKKDLVYGSSFMITFNENGEKYDPKKYINIAVPNLIVKDFTFTPPYDGESGILTIVGYSKTLGKNVKVRSGTIDIPTNGIDIIANHFTHEFQLEDVTYSSVDRLEINGILSPIIFIEASNKIKRGSNVTIETLQKVIVHNSSHGHYHVPGLHEEFKGVSMSKFEKYYTIITNNGSNVYNISGSKVDSTLGNAMFV